MPYNAKAQPPGFPFCFPLSSILELLLFIEEELRKPRNEGLKAYNIYLLGASENSVMLNSVIPTAQTMVSTTAGERPPRPVLAALTPCLLHLRTA